MKRLFPQDHKPIPFSFRQNSEDFRVDEIFPGEPADRGNYLLARIEKRNLSTIEMLGILEAALHCHGIGYAGLKDKSATTTQYITMPLKFSKGLRKFSHPQITVLQTWRSDARLNLGDLEGNRFFIRLKKVSRGGAKRIEELLEQIVRHGMPNYFGYQRFGHEDSNEEKAREIAHGESAMKDRKMQRLMTSAHQSRLFNDWLSERIKLGKEIDAASEEAIVKRYGFTSEEATLLKNQPGLFRVLPGDILLDTQSHKWVNVTDLQAVRKPLKERKLLPTGLMTGRKAWRSKGYAGQIEQRYDDLLVTLNGERRPAWVYPAQMRWEYAEQTEQFELTFTLPRGAYATVLLENIANRDLTPPIRKA